MPEPFEHCSRLRIFRLPGAWRVLAVFAFLFFSLASGAFALPPRAFVIENMLLDTEEEETLYVHLDFTVDDEDGLRDMLKDGAILELKVDLSLERERSWWSNKNIEQNVFVFNLRHDPLTREFIFFKPEVDAPPVRDKNLTRLLNATLRKLNLPLVKLSTLAGEGMGREYLVKASLTLKYADVPPWLERSAVFWSTAIIPEHTESLPFHY